MTLAAAEPAGEAAYPPVALAPTTVSLDSVVVREGDHLWKISNRHLTAHLGRQVDVTEIGPYWRETIETNRDDLRSGNPDLIFPGEKISMPAIELP